jgi:hypothetical protein
MTGSTYRFDELKISAQVNILQDKDVHAAVIIANYVTIEAGVEIGGVALDGHPTGTGVSGPRYGTG